MDTNLRDVDTDHSGDTHLSGMPYGYTPQWYVCGVDTDHIGDTDLSGMDTHLIGMFVVWIQTSEVWIHKSVVWIQTPQWYGYRPLSGMDTEVYSEGWHPPVLNQQRRRNQSQPSMHVICNNYEERSPT